MYGSEIYHSREHVIYGRRVKTRSGGLYLRDGERINPYSQARSMVHVHCMVEYVTWRPPPDQRIWYKICPAPDIRMVIRTYIVYSNHQLRVIILRRTPTYLIHVIMVTHCLSIITRLQHRVIYNTFPVILVVSVKYMPVTCNYRTINWFFKFFKFYEFHN